MLLEENVGSVKRLAVVIGESGRVFGVIQNVTLRKHDSRDNSLIQKYPFRHTLLSTTAYVTSAKVRIALQVVRKKMQRVTASWYKIITAYFNV